MIHHVGVLVSGEQRAVVERDIINDYFWLVESKTISEFQCDCYFYISKINSKSTGIELVVPYGGTLLKWLMDKGSGAHHLAFQVSDIEVASLLYRQKGYRMLTDKPTKGIDDTLVNFIYPSTGVLFELVQKL